MMCPPTAEVRELIKMCKDVVEVKLSFAREGDDDGADDGGYSSSADPTLSNIEHKNQSGKEDEVKRRKVNAKSGLPASKGLRIFFLTKNTLLREAQKCLALRREFLPMQEKIKNQKISIPCVFYYGRH